MDLVLAVSTFNGDLEALELVRNACTVAFAGVFTHVAVVDSGDPDRCAQLRGILARDHPDVDYLWSEGNLGAAGNLSRRLEWARRVGADAMLAVNADGCIDPRNTNVMAEVMIDRHAAAVYPTAVLEGDRVDLSYRHPVPIWPSRHPLSMLRSMSTVSVSWGSSNGALYRLAALDAIEFERIVDVWHGWEDLALGLALRAQGALQLMSLRAVQPTASDQRRLGGKGPVVSDKAPWTTYYTVRNLLLISRDHPRLRHRIALRILREFGVILLRDDRRGRYRAALAGLREGIESRTGRRGE